MSLSGIDFVFYRRGNRCGYCRFYVDDLLRLEIPVVRVMFDLFGRWNFFLTAFVH